MMTETVNKLYDENKITILKWTYNCKKTMVLHVLSKDDKASEIFEQIDHEEYNSQGTIFGPAGFGVLYTHKDITPSDYFYAFVEHIHSNNSVKYKGCVEIMSKMTHIEDDMNKIKQHFPFASIIDVEQGTGCRRNYQYYTIKLGELRIW